MEEGEAVKVCLKPAKSLQESTVCVCVSEAVLTICENLNVDMTTQRDGILAHAWDVLDLQSK